MGWCILRCSSQSTLPLLRSLTRIGIEVWTPIEQVTKRVPRANFKRQIEIALLPGYIFARAKHLPELVKITESPVSEHRDFRVFYHCGKLPLIADESLIPLRALESHLAHSEARRRAKGQVPQLHKGDVVKLTEGSFSGLPGTIEAVGKQFTSVRFKGFDMALRIANFYLLPNSEELDNVAA